MENRTAYVYIEDTFCGTLSEIDAGYKFTYDLDYINSNSPRAVSLTLPLKEEPYVSKTLFSFFDGLIPEGWLLATISHNWKLNENDRFGLLLATCYDSIGNVSIRKEKS